MRPPLLCWRILFTLEYLKCLRNPLLSYEALRFSVVIRIFCYSYFFVTEFDLPLINGQACGMIVASRLHSQE